MAEISFHRGKKSKVDNLPFKDGQFIVSALADNKTAAIYADLKDENGELIRVSLDLTELIKRIEYLEDEIELLNLSVTKNVNIANLHTDDGMNLITDNEEKLLFVRI